MLRGPLVNDIGEDSEDCFPELNGMPESSDRVVGPPATLFDQLMGFLIGQSSCQSPPRYKVLIVQEFFLWVGARPPHRVGEVQAQPAAGKLKHGSLFKSVRHPIPPVRHRSPSNL